MPMNRAPSTDACTRTISYMARNRSAESMARASRLIGCIASAAERARDQLASRFMHNGGPSEYLPVVNSADGTMLRRVPDSIIAHYDGPLAGLCTDSNTGDIVMRDNSRVPLSGFRSNISYLAWAMPPPLKATGELSTGAYCICFHLHGSPNLCFYSNDNIFCL